MGSEALARAILDIVRRHPGSWRGDTDKPLPILCEGCRQRFPTSQAHDDHLVALITDKIDG